MFHSYVALCSYISPNSVATLKEFLLMESVKARCSIEVAQNASCDMSMCISTAQARTKCLSRHFPGKFQHKMPLVTCPCAF